MESVITRIIDIEKRSAAEIEQARTACRNNVDARRRALADEKKRVQAQIVEKENARIADAVEELNKKAEEESRAAMREYETIFQDRAKVAAVKGKIAAILLSGE